MSNKHTPGPWKARKAAKRGGYVIGQDPATPFIGGHYVNISHTPQEANARLIAAAPDLLEAAKAMVAGGYVMDFESPEWAALEAAIARAEGGN